VYSYQNMKIPGQLPKLKLMSDKTCCCFNSSC